MALQLHTSDLHVLATGAALPGPRARGAHGAELPGAVLDNRRLSELVERARAILAEAGVRREVPPCSPDFPAERIGVLERRVLAEGLSVRDLAVAAARDALSGFGTVRRASLVARLRAVLVASVSVDGPVPSVASEVAGAIGAPREVLAADLVQGCSGYVAALQTASALLRTHGPDALALVVGAEAMTRVLDASDRVTAPIFGDGAGALLVAAPPGPAFPPATLTLPEGGPRIRIEHADGDHGPVLRAVARGDAVELAEDHRSRLVVHLEGRAVFRDMVRLLPVFVGGALEGRGVRLDSVPLVALHQANRRLVDAVLAELGVEPERAPSNIARVGNTTAASLPLLLHGAVREGRVAPGREALLVGFGTGYCAGLILLRLP